MEGWNIETFRNLDFGEDKVKPTSKLAKMEFKAIKITSDMNFILPSFFQIRLKP